MHSLKKIFALLFLAIQMGVFEYAIFHVYGWKNFIGISGFGIFFWLIIVTGVGNEKKW